MLLFSFTFPATKWALEGFSPWFVAFGRAAVAAVLACAALALRRAPRPSRLQVRRLLVVAGGVVVGFPLLSSLALRTAGSAHGAIVIALLPAATAVAAVLFAGERPSPLFWLATAAGVAIVTAFAIGQSSGSISGADLYLLAAVAVCGVGYAEGGALSRELGAIETICWALVLSLPLTLVVAALALPASEPSGKAVAGFAYSAVASMFLGFFAWYGGLARGGVARVGQLQLFQPLLTVGWSALILGEAIGWPVLVCGLGVIASVAVGQRARVRGAPVRAVRSDGRRRRAVVGAQQAAERRRRDAEVERDGEVERDPGRRQEDPDPDPDEVEQEARLVHERRLDGVRLLLVEHEAVMLGRVAHEHRQREGEHEERQPVEDDRDPLRLAFADVLRDELRRERQERDQQQHDEVEPVERRVRRPQRARDRRVLQPDHADRQEARQEGQERRPLVEDRAQQVLRRVAVDAQLEHEQRRRDREDAVAERLEPVDRKPFVGVQVGRHRAPRSRSAPAAARWPARRGTASAPVGPAARKWRCWCAAGAASAGSASPARVCRRRRRASSAQIASSAISSPAPARQPKKAPRRSANMTGAVSAQMRRQTHKRAGRQRRSGALADPFFAALVDLFLPERNGPFSASIASLQAASASPRCGAETAITTEVSPIRRGRCGGGSRLRHRSYSPSATPAISAITDSAMPS